MSSLPIRYLTEEIYSGLINLEIKGNFIIAATLPGFKGNHQNS